MSLLLFSATRSSKVTRVDTGVDKVDPPSIDTSTGEQTPEPPEASADEP